MRRLAGLLGVVAAVCVVAVSVIALSLPDPDPDTLSDPRPEPRPARGTADGPVLDRSLRVRGATARLPAGWEFTGPGSVIRYTDRTGRVTAQISAPAVFDSGFCPRAAGSSRAFAGFLPARAGPPAAVARRTARSWADAVARDPVAGDTGAAGRVVDGVSSRPAGSTAHRADARVELKGGGCRPPSAEITVVAVPTPPGVVAFVLVRDAGARGDLPAHVAAEIVASVRASRPGPADGTRVRDSRRTRRTPDG
ncbi:hypothetical protein [Nocardioides insulae]|uniref:hypothetical protein n=1 Tax=Nocardioides insulae TaxID=394734 RepID=UPI0004160BFF|nr:hypothetical protein [Nocardioides insulae]